MDSLTFVSKIPRLAPSGKNLWGGGPHPPLHLFGAVQFSHAAREKDLHPAIGCAVCVFQQRLKLRSGTGRCNHLVTPAA
jgi:hypothetical protein